MAEKRSQSQNISAVWLALCVFLVLAALAATSADDAWAKTSQTAMGAASMPRGSTGGQARLEGGAAAKGREDENQARSGTRLLVSGKSLHLSCNRSLRDLNKNKLECFGN